MPRQTVSPVITRHSFFSGKGWSLYSPLNSPWQFRSAKATSKSFFGRSGMSRKISQRVFFPLVGKLDIRNSIIGLLSFGRPSAVPMLVISVIIYAVNSCVFRSFAHILKEVKKGSPSAGYRYPSFFIMFISRVRWVVAPCNHVTPRIVSFASIPMNCVSVTRSHNISPHIEINVMRLS